MQGNTDAAAGGRLLLGSVPLLMYDHGMDSDSRQTAFNVADQSLHTQVVPELTENNFHVTPHGWVFLHDPDSACTRLWNPKSGDSIALPTMERDLPINWKCYLSAAPTASSCVVLVLFMTEPRFMYCRVGDRSTQWLEHVYDIGTVPLPPERATPPKKRVIRRAAALGGKFYFQETGQLGVLDFSSSPDHPAISFLDYPHAEFPDESNCADSYLVASGAELFEVNVFLRGFTPEILTARVYKFEHLAEPEEQEVTLREVEDLGDRVFFLSYANEWLLSSASEYGLKGNRIYGMHNVTARPDGGFMYVYDMEKKSLETVRPCKDIKDLMCNPFWMLPPADN